MAPPSGGAEDRTPPRILDIIPAPGTTGVAANADIIIVFSERIKAGSLEEALFIAPPQTESPRIKWQGTKAVIKLKDPIPADRTLSVTVGSGVKDLRNNNLEQSVSFALTAGDKLDAGSIRGYLFHRNAVKGMYVGAWLLDDSTEIAPGAYPPPFLTQTGEGGVFTLNFLPDGLYRVLCWDDKNKDRLYQPGEDRIGIPSRDVKVDYDSDIWLEFYPQQQDTTQVFLLMASAPDNRHFTLKYSRFPGIDIGDITQRTTVASDTEKLAVLDGWYDTSDSTRLILLTDEQKPDVDYRIYLADDTTRRSIAGSARPDTTGPQIMTFNPSSGARDVLSLPGGWIGFNEALSPVKFTEHITLTTSDSQVVPLEVVLDEPNRLRWTAIDSLPKGERCRISLEMSGLRDVSGNHSMDTTWSSTFSIIDPVQYGSVSGRISGIDDEPVIVKARLATGRIDSKSTRVKRDSSFKIDGLQPGKYIIWAFLDRDNDGTFFPGKLEPFWYAEYFTVHPDTLEVRQRWETGGVSIKFR